MPIQKFRLEDYKIFPFIAWSVIILFVLFVYLLTVQLKKDLDELQVAIMEKNTLPPGTLQ